VKKIHTNFLKPSQQQLNNLIKYYQTGRYIDAEKLSLSITQKFPKHLFAWKVLAAVLKKNGRINESILISQKSVQLDPQDAEAHNNLGILLQQQGKLKEAEASYSKAIKLKPDFTDAHFNLGNMLKALGRLKEAEASYSKAIKLKPDFTDAHFNLGNMLKALGRLKEAEASYRKAITFKPNYAEVYNNLGVLQQQQGRLKEAEASYSKAITFKPNYAEVYNNLGVLQQQQGRLKEAEASYSKAITFKPNYAEAHINLGKAMNRQGKLKEAEASFRQAITLEPSLAVAHYNLGKVYKKISKKSKAVECFEKTLKLSSEDLLGATLQLATLGKRKIPVKTPEKFMREFYKKKSKNWDNFEKTNTYRGHLLIKNAFKKTHVTSKKIDILDMGCGTGSLAKILRPYARTLVGVDLSPDMLFKAEEICLYDAIYKKDLNLYLSEVLNHYDTIVAAAVLIHFYDLDNIFLLIKESLKLNGKFIFSIFEETKKKKDLNSFLMYAHYHNGVSVPSIIYVLEKK
jgi:Flp pilus assembly protein TadD/2-polyprenyl-3-methyl-5-hydroxy-6-metoxy-1,4-benzoquinol methylase